MITHKSWSNKTPVLPLAYLYSYSLSQLLSSFCFRKSITNKIISIKTTVTTTQLIRMFFMEIMPRILARTNLMGSSDSSISIQSNFIFPIITQGLMKHHLRNYFSPETRASRWLFQMISLTLKVYR